jgi:hypothetical protein
MRSIFFVPVILVIALAAVSLTARSTLAQRAADECITKPGSAAPEGKHWYFRVNRSDRRHCWYVGPDGMHARASVRPTEPPTPRGLSLPVPVPAESPAKAKPAEIDLANAETPEGLARRASDFQGSHGSVARAPSSTNNFAADSEDDMPLIWPILSSADRAAAGAPPRSAAISERMLALLAGALALAAMIARALFKPVAVDGFGWSDFRGPRHRTSNAGSQAPQVASSRRDTNLHARQADQCDRISAPVSAGGGQLQNGRALPFNKAREQNGLAIGKFERIVMNMQFV